MEYVEQGNQVDVGAGVIKPFQSELNSPVINVLKKDRSHRVCIDLRKLNTISFFDAYPMPWIEDLLERIRWANYMTTLNLCKFPLDSHCWPLISFRTLLY